MCQRAFSDLEGQVSDAAYAGTHVLEDIALFP
jgi:hypothetical protein